MRQPKYFNSKKVMSPKVKNRRDVDNLITSSYKLSVLLFLTVLHDKYGFGRKRLKDVSAYVSDLLDSYNRGYISVDDLNDTLHEETGIKVI